MNETAVYRVNGRILAISRDDKALTTYAHFSDDNGMTWGPVLDYGSQIRTIQAPQLISVQGV
ncbi:MAG TPA: hypothetical protein VH744_09515, partial [Terriglobales bacterium]